MVMKSNESKNLKHPMRPREDKVDAVERQVRIYALMSEEIRRGVFLEGNSEAMRAPSLSELERKK